MNDEPRRMIYLGTYEPGVTYLTIPREILQPVEQKLDAEQARRETEAEKARLAVLGAAKAHGRLKRALRAIGFGRRR